MTTSKEAEVLTRYLIGQPGTTKTAKLYNDVFADNPLAERRDASVLAFMIDHPWSIGYVDAALALTSPHSQIRRRLFVLLAILEATPEYHAHFLPQERSTLYILRIGLVGISGVFKAIFGIILMRTGVIK